jgi:hypothetical protein
MNPLHVLEGLIAGTWLGAYLFTTLVVSPALSSLPLSDAERIRTRSAIGRRYGKLAGPLLLVWLVVLLLQGFEPWTLVRLSLLSGLAGVVGVHGYLIGSRMQALADREVIGDATVARDLTVLQRLSARITRVSLVASLLLAVLALLRR